MCSRHRSTSSEPQHGISIASCRRSLLVSNSAVIRHMPRVPGVLVISTLPIGNVDVLASAFSSGSPLSSASSG